MADTVPIETRYIDNLYMETLRKIQSMVADNILEATVISKLLKDKGCVKPQNGGADITRGINYAFQDSVPIQKGDLLPAGTKETRTQARWGWRSRATHVQRDMFEDTENIGEFQISNTVTNRLTAALDGFGQNQEDDLLRAHVAAETGEFMQGLYDLIPPPATRASGTYGQITRPTGYAQNATTLEDTPNAGDNYWWAPRYMQFHTPLDVTMASDMRHMYNFVGNQQENPDVILATQSMYELYEEFGLDAIQVMHNEKMLNLGFDVLKYKAADLTYSPNVNTGHMLFLNTRHIEWIYNPNMWFKMTEWKQAPLETRRIAHILARCNIVSDQPRRQGLLYVS